MFKHHKSAKIVHEVAYNNLIDDTEAQCFHAEKYLSNQTKSKILLTGRGEEK